MRAWQIRGIGPAHHPGCAGARGTCSAAHAIRLADSDIGTIGCRGRVALVITRLSHRCLDRRLETVACEPSPKLNADPLLASPNNVAGAVPSVRYQLSGQTRIPTVNACRCRLGGFVSVSRRAGETASAHVTDRQLSCNVTIRWHLDNVTDRCHIADVIGWLHHVAQNAPRYWLRYPRPAVPPRPWPG
jgi:hypothetical protein